MNNSTNFKFLIKGIALIKAIQIINYYLINSINVENNDSQIINIAKASKKKATKKTTKDDEEDFSEDVDYKDDNYKDDFEDDFLMMKTLNSIVMISLT